MTDPQLGHGYLLPGLLAAALILSSPLSPCPVCFIPSNMMLLRHVFKTPGKGGGSS